MINLTSREVIGADAIIIALPAPQAYGILGSTVDETNALKIVREIDEIAYQKTYSLAAGYGNREIPDWQGIACNRSPLEFISKDRKSTRLNSSHVARSYAVFCLTNETIATAAQ